MNNLKKEVFEREMDQFLEGKRSENVHPDGPIDFFPQPAWADSSPFGSNNSSQFNFKQSSPRTFYKR